MALKIGKSVVGFAVLSVLVFYSNEIITGIVDLQNIHIAKISGGDYVTVETGQGKLRGFTSRSRDGRPFYEFLSIPFARPPVGDLRFEPPVPFPPWSGVRNALSYGDRCLQFDYLLSMFTGSEDCLTLHVYTPSEKLVNPNSNGELLPVVVFIYGGMFMFGRTDVYRPEYFMDTGVVLVTVNYRLGPLGFLNTGDEVVRGNMGLKDQLEALKWIRDNIRNFGGNPQSVTLMGESAGGASVHYHMFSPSSKGLFHRAISLSGSSLNKWAFAKSPKEQSVYLGKNMGCPTNNSMELVKCLKSLDADVIAVSFKEARDQFHNPLAAFAPTVEAIKDERTFLSEHPKVTLANGKVVNNVPWLLGVNDQEGMIYAGDLLFNKTSAFLLSKHWFKHAPNLFKYGHVSKGAKKQISKALWNYYFKEDKQLRFDSSLQNLSAIFSDIHFFKPLRDTVEMQVNMTDMYLYYYQYQASHGLGQVSLTMTGILPVVLDGLVSQGIRFLLHHVLGLSEKHMGACHTDELGVTFQLPLVINKIRPGSKDYTFSKLFVESLAYFAKHGEPPMVNGHVWPSVQKGRRLYIKMDVEPEIILEPFQERVDFVSNLLAESDA